jgi:hypothetical protein
MLNIILRAIDKQLHPHLQDYACTRCHRSKTIIWELGCGHRTAACQTAPLEFQSPFRIWLRDRWGILLP